MNFFRRKPQPPVTAEWIVVGLGNPGGEYRGTRHNVGFDVVDRIAESHRIKMARGRHRAQVGVGEVRGVSVALIKPLTYMNLSGQAVAPLARELDMLPARILVIADDLDLPVGKLRLKAKGASGGHRGHKSLIASLRTEEYPRLKIGIGSASGETADHVLSAFSGEEREVVDLALRAAVEACEAVIAENWESALRVIERHNTPGRRLLGE